MNPQFDKDTLLRELSDAVLVTSKDGALIYANPAFARILGYSQEAVADKNVGTDLVARTLEWKALISLMEQGGIVQDYEIKFKRADGGISCCTISASNLRDKNGALVGLAMVLRDITTRKGVENELREKAYRIDVMNKIAKIGGAEQDARMKSLVGISSELRKLVDFDLVAVGVTEEKGRHVEVLAPAKDRPDTAVTLGKVPFEGSLVERLRLGQKAILLDKGTLQKRFSEHEVMDLATAESFLSVALRSRGRVMGSLSIASHKKNIYNLDIVDMMQTVADQVAGLIDNMALLSTLQGRITLQDTLVRTGVELQKAISTKEIYAAIANNIRSVVQFTDLSFYVVDWAKGRIYPVYAIGEYADEVMASPGTIDEGVVASVARSGRAEFMDDVDADPRVADVPGIPVEHNSMLAIPLFGADRVTGVLELYRPRGQVFTVSDLEAGQLFAQQASVALANANLVSKLQDAKSEIEMLNDLMFHDINNFNFATLNYLQLLSSSPDIGVENKTHLERTLHLVRQTAELIESVKKLTKIGIMDPKDFAPVDLVETLRRVVSGAQNSFPGRALDINLNLPDSAVTNANKLLDELFVNLLSNAIKYDSHDPVEVDISCEKIVEGGKSFWRVSFADRGVGVPDEKKGLLFQRHVRLKPESGVTGTGLGLSICSELTRKFGGRIWVEDRVPGESELGANFRVLLPAD